jgi:hypothetical protein
MLALNFLSNLHLDCKLLIIGSRGSIAKEYQMPIIISLVVNNVDSRLFRVKENLGILLKGNLLSIIFI